RSPTPPTRVGNRPTLRRCGNGSDTTHPLIAPLGAADTWASRSPGGVARVHRQAQQHRQTVDVMAEGQVAFVDGVVELAEHLEVDPAVQGGPGRHGAGDPG